MSYKDSDNRQSTYQQYVNQFPTVEGINDMGILHCAYSHHMGVQSAYNVAVNTVDYDRTKQTLFNHGKKNGLISNRRKDILRKGATKDNWLLSDNPLTYDIKNKEIGIGALAECWHIDFKRATFKPMSTAHHAERMLKWTLGEYFNFCNTYSLNPTTEDMKSAVILLGIITHPISGKIYHKIWYDNHETQNRVEQLIMLATQYGEQINRVVIDRDTNDELTAIWAKHGITQIHMGKTVKLPYGAWAEQPFSNIAKTMYAQRSGECPSCLTENGNPTQIMRQRNNRTEILKGVYAVTCKRCGHEMIVYEWKEMELTFAVEMFKGLVEVFYYNRIGTLMGISERIATATEQLLAIPTVRSV